MWNIRKKAQKTLLKIDKLKQDFASQSLIPYLKAQSQKYSNMKITKKDNSRGGIEIIDLNLLKKYDFEA